MCIVCSNEQILGEIDLRQDNENPCCIFERLTATINTGMSGILARGKEGA